MDDIEYTPRPPAFSSTRRYAPHINATSCVETRAIRFGEQGLVRADAGWTALRNMKTGEEAGPAPTFVTESETPFGAENPPTFDVLVCGGTLGIFVATALQMRYVRSYAW